MKEALKFKKCFLSPCSMPCRVPGTGDLNGDLMVAVPAPSANEPGWETRQAVTTVECSQPVQTEVAGYLRGHVTRYGHGVGMECSPWEVTGTGTYRLS